MCFHLLIILVVKASDSKPVNNGPHWGFGCELKRYFHCFSQRIEWFPRRSLLIVFRAAIHMLLESEIASLRKHRPLRDFVTLRNFLRKVDTYRDAYEQRQTALLAREVRNVASSILIGRNSKGNSLNRAEEILAEAPDQSDDSAESNTVKEESSPPSKPKDASSNSNVRITYTNLCSPQFPTQEKEAMNVNGAGASEGNVKRQCLMPPTQNICAMSPADYLRFLLKDSEKLPMLYRLAHEMSNLNDTETGKVSKKRRAQRRKNSKKGMDENDSSAADLRDFSEFIQAMIESPQPLSFPGNPFIFTERISSQSKNKRHRKRPQKLAHESKMRPESEGENTDLRTGKLSTKRKRAPKLRIKLSTQPELNESQIVVFTPESPEKPRQWEYTEEILIPSTLPNELTKAKDTGKDNQDKKGSDLPLLVRTDSTENFSAPPSRKVPMTFQTPLVPLEFCEAPMEKIEKEKKSPRKRFTPTLENGAMIPGENAANPDFAACRKISKNHDPTRTLKFSETLRATEALVANFDQSRKQRSRATGSLNGKPKTKPKFSKLVSVSTLVKSCCS